MLAVRQNGKKQKSKYWKNWAEVQNLREYILLLGKTDTQFTETSDHTVFVLHLRYQIPSCGFNTEWEE